MEHKWLRLFKNGEWTGSPDRMIAVNGEWHNLDEYAKEHGIELPVAQKKAKSKKKSDVEVNSYGDMGEEHHEGHSEESGE